MQNKKEYTFLDYFCGGPWVQIRKDSYLNYSNSCLTDKQQQQ